MNTKDELKEIISQINLNEFSVLLGAGISIDSGIPMVGYVLDDKILVDGIETYILQRMGFTIDEISKFINLIPFETFFEVLIDNGLDLNAFVEIFKSKPATIHNFIANMVAIGRLRSIGTTNFDDCIEQALDNLHIKYIVSCYNPDNNSAIQNATDNIIWKFHGSINEIENLGISIKNISNKKNLEKRKKEITQFIESSNTIIVCGYSCSDIFDLTPFFSSANHATKNINIIYINHINDDTINIVSETDLTTFPKVYKMFHNYNLKIICCNTVKFIRTIEAHLNISPSDIYHYTIPWKAIIESCLMKFDKYKRSKIKGNLYFKISEFKKSIASLENAIDNANNEECIIACKRSIAWAYDKMGNSNDSMRILEQLCNDKDVIAERHSLHYANIFSQLGICYACKDGYERKANEYFELAYKIASKHQYERELGYILINWAELHKKNDPDLALFEIEQAKEILYTTGYLEDVGICYSNIAAILMKQKKLSEAKDNIEKAMEIADEFGNYNALFHRATIKIDIDVMIFVDNAIKEITKLGALVANGDDLLMRANYEFYLGKLLHINGNTKEAITKWSTAKKIYDELSSNSTQSKANIQYLDEHKCLN